jgi:hypothetical protein
LGGGIQCAAPVLKLNWFPASHEAERWLHLPAKAKTTGISNGVLWKGGVTLHKKDDLVNEKMYGNACNDNVL